MAWQAEIASSVSISGGVTSGLTNLVIATSILAVGQSSSGPPLKPITDPDAYAIFGTFLHKVSRQPDDAILLVPATTTLASLSLILVADVTSFAPGQEDRRTPRAKAVLVWQLDPRLPRLSLEHWMSGLARPGTTVSWTYTKCPATYAYDDPRHSTCVVARAESVSGRVAAVSVWLAEGRPETWGTPRIEKSLWTLEQIRCLSCASATCHPPCGYHQRNGQRQTCEWIKTRFGAVPSRLQREMP